MLFDNIYYAVVVASSYKEQKGKNPKVSEVVVLVAYLLDGFSPCSHHPVASLHCDLS